MITTTVWSLFLWILCHRCIFLPSSCLKTQMLDLSGPSGLFIFSLDISLLLFRLTILTLTPLFLSFVLCILLLSPFVVFIVIIVLWPPHVKSSLIGKDPDAGRNWGQEEKGTTEDEMAGWHHWLDGRESQWTPGVGDGQGGLACCDSWGRKESDTTEGLIWSDLIVFCNLKFSVWFFYVSFVSLLTFSISSFVSSTFITAHWSIFRISSLAFYSDNPNIYFTWCWWRLNTFSPLSWYFPGFWYVWVFFLLKSGHFEYLSWNSASSLNLLL